MGLLTDIQQRTEKRGPVCAIHVIETVLSKTDVGDLRKAMADLSIPSTAIAAVLKDRGHKTSGDTVRRHRKGECACEPS